MQWDCLSQMPRKAGHTHFKFLSSTTVCREKNRFSQERFMHRGENLSHVALLVTAQGRVKLSSPRAWTLPLLIQKYFRFSLIIARLNISQYSNYAGPALIYHSSPTGTRKRSFYALFTVFFWDIPPVSLHAPSFFTVLLHFKLRPCLSQCPQFATMLLYLWPCFPSLTMVPISNCASCLSTFLSLLTFFMSLFLEVPCLTEINSSIINILVIYYLLHLKKPLQKYWGGVGGKKSALASGIKGASYSSG